MVNIHASEKTQTCETCGKTFVLEWRLNKHLGIHQENVKCCKFFKKGRKGMSISRFWVISLAILKRKQTVTR